MLNPNITIKAPAFDDEIIYQAWKAAKSENFSYSEIFRNDDDNDDYFYFHATFKGNDTDSISESDLNYHLANLTAKLNMLQKELNCQPPITYKLYKPEIQMATVNDRAKRRGRPPINRGSKPNTTPTDTETTVEVPISHLEQYRDYAQEVNDKATEALDILENIGADTTTTTAAKANLSAPQTNSTSRPTSSKSPTKPIEVTPMTNSSNNSNSSNQSEAAKRVKADEQRKKQDAQITSIIDTITYYTTLIVSVPFRIFGSILENFVDRRLPGTKILGFLFFFGSIIVTADSYWQASGNAAILPFFNDTFSGWSFFFFFSPFFWGLVVFCLGMQLLQSETLRGMTAAEAKSRVEEMSAYDAGSAPQGKIKMASIYHKNYVNAGVRHNRFRSLFALGSIVVDAIVTFAARNPYDWADKMFLGFWVVVAFNIISLVIAEAGYVLWKGTK